MDTTETRTNLEERALAAMRAHKAEADRERQEREDADILAERQRRWAWWQQIDQAILDTFGIERPTELASEVEAGGLIFGIAPHVAYRDAPVEYRLLLHRRCDDCGQLWTAGDSIKTLADLGYWLENPRHDYYDHGPGACVPYRADATPAIIAGPPPQPEPTVDDRLVYALRDFIRDLLRDETNVSLAGE